MQRVDTIGEVREAVQQVRRQGLRVALVPTMGSLHAGHLALVERARQLADYVAVSLFVNPLQFGPADDFDRYPRDPEQDARLARQRGVDLLFTPGLDEMYPQGEPWTAVVPIHGGDVLCGAARPGHFRGVLTVVAKLLGIFTPDVAVFGQKDFQQAVLVRRMVSELAYPVEVEVAPTVRDADGLALSSRNAYLSSAERGRALSLWRALERCRQLWEAGESDAGVLRAAMRSVVASSSVQVEYAEVVDPATLEPRVRVGPGAVCAVAARVGATRLIDNLVLATPEPPPQDADASAAPMPVRPGRGTVS